LGIFNKLLKKKNVEIKSDSRSWLKRLKLIPSKGTSKLKNYLCSQRNYIFFIGSPAKSPCSWQKVTGFDNDLISYGEETTQLTDVKSYIVAYPNGEIVDGNNIFEPLPEGINYIKESFTNSQEILSLQLDDGKQFVEISHGHSETHSDPRYYSTTIKNIFNEKIRVIKFGGFNKKGKRYILSNVSGEFYSAEQFINWYNASTDGWILPGESVSDPSNYGHGYWVFFCETETGKQFIAGQKSN
jgi:hypothetical protein